jgi:hypothetical protein
MHDDDEFSENKDNDKERREDDQANNDIQSQEVQHQHIGALVPEKVARGVFSTGAVILNGNFEFVIDFLLRMNRPHQVAARVVLPPQVVARMIQALTENLANYTQRFGEPKLPDACLPKPGQPPQPQVSAEDLYEQLKFGQTDMWGAYANAVMIGHSPTEFSFDFITTFFPRSVVSNRVFLAAPNVPRFLDSLKHSYGQFQQKLRQQPPPPPPDTDTFDTTQF